METGKNNGIVLLCDENGVIKKVIYDDFNFFEDCEFQGKLFSSIISKGSSTMAIDFFVKVRNSGMYLDCPLTIKLKKSYSKINFSGFFLSNEICIIGAEKISASAELIDKFQQINNEQANQIRSLLKKSYKSDQINWNDSYMFDEFSKLNNELVNLQRELTKKNSELEQLNELKNEFLSTAAHDLRNPIGIIQAYSDFLIDETKNNLSDKHKEFLQIINSTSGFLQALIEDLLDISQIESGTLNLNKEYADIVELAEKNIKLNNTLAEKKNISINFDCSTKPVYGFFDRNKMEQVFNNLLTNAVKFSYPNSVIDVRVTWKESSVFVEVKDEGIGVSDKEKELIFQPFSKAWKKGTKGEKSTGLGLSIVKNIIEGHGGYIAVDSKATKGSRFYFELPLQGVE